MWTHLWYFCWRNSLTRADNIESLRTIPDNFYKTSFCHQQYIYITEDCVSLPCQKLQPSLSSFTHSFMCTATAKSNFCFQIQTTAPPHTHTFMGQAIISSYYAAVPFYFCTILYPLNPLLKISLVIYFSPKQPLIFTRASLQGRLLSHFPFTFLRSLISIFRSFCTE